MKDIHLLRYKKVLDEINTHIQRLEYAFNRLKNLGYLSFLDQISYRYSKLQDSLGKVIRSYLYIKGEYPLNRFPLKILNSIAY